MRAVFVSTKIDQNIQNRLKHESKKKSSSNIQSLVKTSLFDVGITNSSANNILEYIVKLIENSDENIYVVTPNPEMIVSSNKNPQVKTILNQAQIALCD